MNSRARVRLPCVLEGLQHTTMILPLTACSLLTASRSPTYRVLLDDRIILTPQSRPLWTPSEALSYAVAAEWDMQEKTITPHMMPLVRAAANPAPRPID